jgi:hypothetical protein
MKGENMKWSSEVRWFYHQALPLEVKNWFCGSRLCKEEDARTDHYLLLSGSNEVGVKVRDGRKLEIKARTAMPQPLSLETGASVGRQDTWVKWSHEDREVAARLAALEGDSPEWLAVAKKRWIRKFRLDAAGNAEETDPSTELDLGCKVELSEVTVRGESWWTVAFESFGKGNRTMNLEPFARHFLKVLPHGIALTERDSMAYPEWLSRLTG